MAPAIPAIVVLSIFGLKNLVDIYSQQCELTKNIGMVFLTILIFCTLIYNAKYIHHQFAYIQPLAYLSKKVDRDTYISHFRFEHFVIQYANETLPKDARVLCLSIGDRTYNIERDVHLSEDFYNRVNGTFTESDLLKKLKRHGTTHIIFYKNAYLDWARQLKQEERNMFENVFDKNTKLLFEKNGVLLLELNLNAT
jgi:hypothetical protein